MPCTRAFPFESRRWLEEWVTVASARNPKYRPYMSASQPRPSAPDTHGLHLATIAHEGLIWDAYLDLENDLHRPTSFRGLLRFEPPAGNEGPEPTQTGMIIIEVSHEEAVAKARSFDDRQLQGLLRSALPDTDPPV
jgi:hypothetical protein